jgi:hypothetical protein
VVSLVQLVPQEAQVLLVLLEQNHLTIRLLHIRLHLHIIMLTVDIIMLTVDIIMLGITIKFGHITMLIIPIKFGLITIMIGVGRAFMAQHITTIMWVITIRHITITT